MTPKPTFKGCGGNAAHVIFRGYKRRLFTCGDCVGKYEGGGKPSKYALDVAGQEKEKGVFYGVARTCGHAIEGDDS